MPFMQSPDGAETVEVPDADVAHYQSLGATLVQPPAASVTMGPNGFPISEYTGPNDQPIEANPLLNPLEIGIDLLSGRGALQATGQALGRIPEMFASRAPRVAGTAIKETGRAVGRRLLGKGNFDDLAKGIVKAARGAGQEAETTVAKAATKAKPKGLGGAATRVARKVASKAKPKPRLAVVEGGPGSAASRAARPSQAMRGASGLELDRRAAARAAAVGRPAAMEAPGATSQGLQAQLALEQHMQEMGLDQGQKLALRQQIAGLPDSERAALIAQLIGL